MSERKLRHFPVALLLIVLPLQMFLLIVVAQPGPSTPIKILNVGSPSEVEAGQSFTVSVAVEYSFPSLNQVSIGILDYDSGSSAGGSSPQSDTLSGVGSKTYSFTIVALSNPVNWHLSAVVFYLSNNQWLQGDGREFWITVKPGAGPSIVSLSYGHYYAKVPREFQEKAMQWIKDVNDHSYPVMVETLGFQPTIDFYIVEFKQLQTAGGYYAGVETIDGYTGGHIVLHIDGLKFLQSFPDDLAYGLTYETIHGFLEPVKHPPYTSRRTVLDWDESFDIIFEVEVLARLNLPKYVKELHDVFYPMKEFRYFAVLWDIREDFGWGPFQEFFRQYASSAVDDNTLCYYLSTAANADLSPYFRRHNISISEEYVIPEISPMTLSIFLFVTVSVAVYLMKWRYRDASRVKDYRH